MSVNKLPNPKEIKGIGMNINQGLSGVNVHHFRMYPTIDRAVEMINAFFFPHFEDIADTIGITKIADTNALIELNQAGQVPVAP